MKRGKFITLYGVNNIGKSTQARLLVERLKDAGYDVVYLKYPIYDLEPTGPQIDAIMRSSGKQALSEEDLQKLFVQNRKDFEPQLEKMLEEGKIIIAEDYIGTGIAWGMAKGLDQKLLEGMNKNLIHEDFAILLQGKRHEMAREKQHLHEQNDQLLQNVSKIFIQLGADYGWQSFPMQPKIQDTADQLWSLVSSFLQQSMVN